MEPSRIVLIAIEGLPGMQIAARSDGR